MHLQSLCLPVLAGFFLGGVLPAQDFQQDIPLAGLGNGNPARPFGIQIDPQSGKLFVPLAGTFGANNDVVVVIDAATSTVTGTIPAGDFPEDVALVRDSAGNLLFGAVTNSSGDSVTIWDAADAPLATIDLPGDFNFPFGITPSEDGSRLLVGTVGGQGDVFAIDLAALSLDPAASFNLGPVACGRLRSLGGRVVVPTTRFNAAFDGSEGGMAAWNTTNASLEWSRLFLERDGALVFPSSQDMEVLPDGRLVVGGTSFGDRLYLLAQDGTLLRTLRLRTAGGDSHGLALSPDGKLLAVCDFAGSSLALVDMLNFRQIGRIDLQSVGAGYDQPNDAVFFGGRLFVSCQGSEFVVVFDNLPDPQPGPGYAGSLAVSNPSPAPGESGTVTVTGPGKVVLLFSQDDLPGPFRGVELDIGPAPRRVKAGSGSAALSFSIPSKSGLKGRAFFFQGVVDVKNNPRPTEPRVLIVQ
ncbi:MAG: YncE family protein [Planctomycetota bacterium]